MVWRGDNEIHVLAAMWAARLDRGALSELEKVFLDNWLTGDSRRLGALARAQASLVPFAELQYELPDQAGPAALPPDAARPVREARHHSRRRLLQLGGAMAAVAASGAGFLLFPGSRDEVVQTGPGEVRMLPLVDGSMVTLNTDSQMTVDFTSQRRTVHLIRGEALFDIAKDPERPFLVQAGAASVTAIGTSFVVRRTGQLPVRVAVQSGVVEVAALAGRRQSQLLGANMQATAGEEGRVVARPMGSGELNRDLAWREGKIAFSGTSLREAVGEFNRYNQLKLEIDDEAIAGRTMTGLFSATNPKGFAAAVALSLEVDFYEMPERIVFTSRRQLPKEQVVVELL